MLAPPLWDGARATCSARNRDFTRACPCLREIQDARQTARRFFSARVPTSWNVGKRGRVDAKRVDASIEIEAGKNARILILKVQRPRRSYPRITCLEIGATRCCFPFSFFFFFSFADAVSASLPNVLLQPEILSRSTMLNN